MTVAPETALVLVNCFKLDGVQVQADGSILFAKTVKVGDHEDTFSAVLFPSADRESNISVLKELLANVREREAEARDSDNEEMLVRIREFRRYGSN